MAGEKRSMPGNNQLAKRQKGQKVRFRLVPILVSAWSGAQRSNKTLIDNTGWKTSMAGRSQDQH